MTGPRVRTRGSSAKRLPAVDDHFVAEGSRVEVVRGRLYMTPPAREPHGEAHLTLAYVLGAVVGPGWQPAVDLLTRTSHDSDFAPDASVYPKKRDPETGGRQLEELAFEIAETRIPKLTTLKARELSRRGVRRVFCVLLSKERVLEWSRATDTWSPMAAGDEILDRCFVRPLPIAALLDAAAADRAVVDALEARRHPAIVEIERRERSKTLRTALLAVLSARQLVPTAAERTEIRSETSARRLRSCIERAATADTVRQALARGRRSKRRA